MSKLKDATMIDATEERKNRMNGESCLLTPHEAKIHDDIFINELEATIEDKEIGIDGHSKKWQLDMLMKLLIWFDPPPTSYIADT